ncbi:MAG: ThiF family adenylyltransferase [Elusimicrobia bacterium]|nr:ThiF family adenylyltransferase [Elusimicrobiota bacterium]
MTLTKEEFIRYSRQLVVPDVGPEGQLRLKSAKVAVVGAGGLGSMVLACLAGAGVGELGIFDSGPVELSNLHRQFAYATSDVGKLKTALAAARLREINPGIKAAAREGLLTAENMKGALAGYDQIADCTDNFRTRSAINRACLELGKTYVHAAVYRMEGQLAVFEPGKGPCLGCLSPLKAGDEAQACAEAGVLGPAAAAVGALQALEVIKLILGLETLKGRFAMLDFGSFRFSVAELPRWEDCPVCGKKAAHGPSRRPAASPRYISPEELKRRLASATPPRLLDLRFDWEHGLAHIPGGERADYDELLRTGAGLSPEEELVLYCKGQSKSAAAWKALNSMGFKNVFVLEGGIDAWAEKIDRNMTRY